MAPQLPGQKSLHSFQRPVLFYVQFVNYFPTGRITDYKGWHGKGWVGNVQQNKANMEVAKTAGPLGVT